jgi:hypothetical protein
MANSITVQAAMEASNALAAGLIGQLDTYGANLTALAEDVNYIFPEIDLITDPVDSANIIGRVETIQAPSDNSYGSPTLDAPIMGELGVISVPEFGNIPELVVAVPVVNLPPAPSNALPSAPGSAPGFTSPTIPDDPTLVFPDVPSFSNVVIPPMPSYTIPTYGVVFPDDDLLSPTFTFEYTEQQYQDDLLDELKRKLMADLVNGGYGIEPLDEQLLWERAREREMLAAETTIRQAMDSAASRGFTAPPGALLALLEGAQQAALEKISSVSRDIALKRADMYVENRKFTITEVRETEQMLITYFGYMMERALNVAKYTLEASKSTYDALVERYRARIAGAQAAASAYEVQLKAGLAALEAYKVEMEGVRASVDVQKLLADVYTAQLSGVKTYVDVYRTQMEAAKIFAEVEKLKLDAFRATVDTYTAQVSAKSAEFGMYKAQIDGEMAKVDIYKAQVSAYGEEVQAYSAVAGTKKLQFEVGVENARLVLDTYKYDLDGFSTAMQTSKITLDALLGKHQADTQRYTAKVDAQAAVSTATATVSKANADIALAKAKVAGDYATTTAQQLTNRSKLTGDLNKDMFSSLATTASNALTANAGIALEPGT